MIGNKNKIRKAKKAQKKSMNVERFVYIVRIKANIIKTPKDFVIDG